MRSLLIILSILIFGISAFAQYTDPNFEEFNNLYFRNRSVPNNLEYKDIEGHPYSNEELVPGTIEFVSGLRMDSIPMRYNWYTKIMEFMPEKEILEVPASKDIKQVELGGEKYIPFFYLNSIRGYLVELYRDDLSLFRENQILFVDAKPAASGYEEAQPARFKWTRPDYIVITEKGKLIKLEQSKKRLPDQFPDFENALTEYIKVNKTNLKEEDDLKNLIIEINHWKKQDKD